MSKIRPCPFCGCESPKLRPHYYGRGKDTTYSYFCPNCEASTYRFFKKESEALKAWNLRVTEIHTSEEKIDAEVR